MVLTAGTTHICVARVEEVKSVVKSSDIGLSASDVDHARSSGWQWFDSDNHVF